MDLYNATSYKLSELLTKKYSTSFSLSSRLFASDIRKHIYAIYGLVRIADEIVDTYRKKDARQKLDSLEKEVIDTIKTQYSSNPIVQSYAVTAKKYAFDSDLISAFFESMRVDLSKQKFTTSEYKNYIYGSAEAIGLMCLSVFVDGEKTEFDRFKVGASALGSAYQKVNFLRDISQDYQELERIYFPGVNYETYNEADKQKIITDIKADFQIAAAYINKLPKSARPAVRASYNYYLSLLKKLEQAPVAEIKTKRLRINNFSKLLLLCKAKFSNV